MAEEPTRNSVLVELHVPDFEKVKEYYAALGFTVTWERQPEGAKGYLIMKRGDNVLCFWPGNDEVARQPYFSRFPVDTKRGYGVEIVIMIEDVEDFYQSVKEIAGVVEELIMQPWGLKDFRAEDPFGYYLRFTEPHSILNDKNAIE